MRGRRILAWETNEGTRELSRKVAQIALPLRGPADLDPLLGQIGDARYVLLGEASHGTSEYYQWRGADQPATHPREGVCLHRGGGRLD